MSVISLRAGRDSQERNSSARSSHTMGGPTSTNNLIAIGRMDGEVHIYDSLGLSLKQQSISSNGEKIINVEWIKGPSPKPIAENIVAPGGRDLPGLSFEEHVQQSPTYIDTVVSSSTVAIGRRETLFDHVGLPPALRRPKQAEQSNSGPQRKFTVHPDEIDDGTVRHNPKASTAEQESVVEGDYLDLFSPVKSPKTDGSIAKKQRVSSPPQSRPRISSQTFVKSPKAMRVADEDEIARPRNLSLFPSTDSESSIDQTTVMKSELASAEKTTPSPYPKRGILKADARRRSRRSRAFSSRAPALNNNAKVLADLRKMSTANHPCEHTRGVLAAFGSTKSPWKRRRTTSPKKKEVLRILHRATDHIETEHDSDSALKAYTERHERLREDSNQDSSLGDDIWITSDSGDNTTQLRRRPHGPKRPPARQTSRSRVDSKGTLSTVAQNIPQPRFAVDGSTEEEMLEAEFQHSSEDTFLPSSKDVRELFPRSSSLSPRKYRKKNLRSPTKGNHTLRDIAPNAAAGRQRQTPWERAKAGSAITNHAKPLQHQSHAEKKPSTQNQGPNRPRGGVEPHCTVCSSTKTKVNDLEHELFRLKGEVIAMKAALRQNDVPLPFSLRYS